MARGFLFCIPRDLCFHFLGVAVGAEVAFFRPLWSPGVACWVISLVLRVSAVASPAAWCQYVDGLVGVFSGVVSGSDLGAFNYLDDFSTFNNY